jgi:coenzyme F420-0:L-glutamate ligase / coenzyme F420-1:gamma-L-glutamate ligase
MAAEIAGAILSDELDALIRTRRSIRYFRDDPLSRSVVADLLERTLWAPSPHNVQPWRFTVLFEAGDKAALGDAMADELRRELKADGLDEKAIEAQTARSRGRIAAAPVIILCSLHADGLVAYADQRRSSLEWRMAVQSVGAVLQTLFLLAAARGIGTCWMAAPMYCPDVVRSVLDLPDEVHPQALVLMGYPARPGRVRPLRPRAEVVDLR